MNDPAPFEVFHLHEIESERVANASSYSPFLQRPGLVTGLYHVAAGESDEASHGIHEEDEVYYVVRGRGKISLDGRDEALTPGSIVYVAKGAVHFFHEVEEDLSLLVFFAG